MCLKSKQLSSIELKTNYTEFSLESSVLKIEIKFPFISL